jgi:hypothetical protein
VFPDSTFLSGGWAGRTTCLQTVSSQTVHDHEFRAGPKRAQPKLRPYGLPCRWRGLNPFRGCCNAVAEAFHGNNILDSAAALAYRIAMKWTTRAYSDEDINAAGRALIARRSTPDEVLQAIAVINNWRAAHAFPLNTMQMWLRGQASQIDPRSVSVSQRIKRLPAIESKLRRLKSVTLADMQDIAGCRAVVTTKAKVMKLRKAYRSARIRHEPERENDYITTPTPDGYRSLHLVYRYYSDRNQEYNGQRIEIQIRRGRPTHRREAIDIRPSAAQDQSGDA